MPEDVIIIGSDAGVGKTHVACALLRDLRARGLQAMGYKPICCGDRAEARAMRDATEPGISLECINPLYLRAQAAPCIAAELQRVDVDLAQLVAGYRALKEAGYGPIIIEGNGGWETPLAPGCTMAALAQAFGLSVLLVVANRRGAANHAIMTAREIQRCGLSVKGIVLNQMSAEWDTAAVTNRKLVEDFTALPVVAELINGQEDIDSSACC